MAGKRDRFFIFGIGVFIGCVLVSLLMSRREAFRETQEASWNIAPEAVAGIPPLPSGVESVMLEGRLLYYGEDEASAVWIVGFTDRYPYIRIVQDQASGEMRYMAADQVVIALAQGVDVAALRPVLDDLGVRVRMFNRRENVAVIGTIEAGVDAIPRTIEALVPYAHLYQSVEPDWIRFRDGERQGLFF